MKLTAERVRELLDYRPDTGELVWRIKPNRCIVLGATAGRTSADGYIRVGIDGRQYPAHRLAWLLTFGDWPLAFLDHINGQRADNRLANLRAVSHQENCHNVTVTRSRSGLVGVYERAGRNLTKRFNASIKVNNRTVYLGYYATAQEARSAYLAAKQKLHFGAVL